MASRVFAAAILILIGWLSVAVPPPVTAKELVFAQLRLAVHGSSSKSPHGTVLAARSIHAVPAPQHARNTPTLYRGERRVVSPGKPGKVALQRSVRIAPDGLARAQSVERVPLAPPKPSTVLVGTTTPHYLMRGGVLYRYMRRLQLVATAYNGTYAQNGPWGATAALNGAPLAHGMVAVDPTVIPLGTRLYVQGYGPALAADTGSAIIGNRIDLYFEQSTQETSKFGIKKLNVYILGLPGA